VYDDHCAAAAVDAAGTVQLLILVPAATSFTRIYQAEILVLNVILFDKDQYYYMTNCL